MSSGTQVMMGRLHGDRWSALGDHAGIAAISSLLSPDELRRFEILSEFDDEFLREIAPDLSLVQWKADQTLFEAGSYLDLAFYIVDGVVEVAVPEAARAHRPIFAARTQAMAALPREEPAAPAGTGRPSRNQTVFLAALDVDPGLGERMELGPDEILGEIGAVNGWPQSVSARTRTMATLFQIRAPALRKLRRRSKRLKARLDELYRERALRHHLASTPLLDGCPPRVIDRLAERAELVSCQPGDIVAREGEPADGLLMVRSGFLSLSQRVGSGDVVVSYLSKGSTLGELELAVAGHGRWEVTAEAAGHTELVRIRYTELEEVLSVHPELRDRLWDVAVERVREIGFTRRHLARSDLIDFTLSAGLAQGNSILVIDLESCTRCDDCVRGCASTHGGIPRFVREGEVYDGFLVTRSCYHCEDPVCLVGCPTGAIRRANVGAVVEIDPAICIGCGACASNCPYDAIVMQGLGTEWGPDAVPKYLRGQPRSLATKCDLCYTSPAGPACVSSCPHGSATRVSSFEEFDVLLSAKRRAGRGP